MRPHTAGRGGGRGRHRARLAGRLPASCSAAGSSSPPTSTTCWPAGRSPTPETYEGFAMHEDGIGMARTFEREFRGAADARPPASRSGFFAWVDGAPAEGYRAPRVAADGTHPGAAAPDGRRARRRAHRPARRPGPRPAGGRAGSDRRAGRHRAPTSSSAATSASTGLMVGDDLARVLAARARGPPLPAARRVPVAGPVPRRHRARRPAPTGRGRADRRRRAAGRPEPGDLRWTSPSSPSSAAPTWASRTLAQPHRRPPRGDRRGEARRHPRPQGGRGRVAGRDRSCWSTPAAGCPAAATSTAKVSQQSERAIRDAAGGADGGRRRGRRHRGGQPGGRPAAPGRRAGAAWWPTRSTTPTARPAVWEFVQPRPGRSVSRSARCTVVAPATCSTRSCAVLPEAEPDAAEVEAAYLAEHPGRPGGDKVFSVAFVGRPNVGKSTLFNRLIGDDRSVVHDLPGTTRDSIDTVVDTADGPVRFVDTAGMRRKAPHRRGHRVLLVRAGAAVDRHGRRRPAGHRRHGRRDPPGPAAGRAHRRGRLPGGGAAEQVGDPRRRAAGRGHLPGGPEAALPRRVTGAQDQRADRQGRQPAAAGAGRHDRRLPQAGARPGRSTR